MFFAAIVVLMPSAREPLLHLGLENLAEVDFGEAQVAVRVALHLAESFEIAGRDVEDESFGDDRDAIAASLGEPLDDRADERVHDRSAGESASGTPR